MAKIVDQGVTRYDWIPGATGITTPLAPKLTDLSATGAKNITPLVVRTTDINSDPSDTVDEPGVADTSKSVVPTLGNYHGELVLWRSLDATTGAAATDDLMSVIKKGDFGWICRRNGKSAAAALAVGDEVEVYLFLVDNIVRTGGEGDGFLKAKIHLLPQGNYQQGVAVVA